MAIITGITEDWSAGDSLTSDTVYSVDEGAVRIVSASAQPTDPRDGITLAAGQVIRFSSGLTVYWKNTSSADVHMTSTAV